MSSVKDLLDPSFGFTILSYDWMTAEGALILIKGIRFAINGVPAGIIDQMYLQPTALDKVMKTITVVQPKTEHPEVGKIWVNEQADETYFKRTLEESADQEVRGWMMYETIACYPNNIDVSIELTPVPSDADLFSAGEKLADIALKERARPGFSRTILGNKK